MVNNYAFTHLLSFTCLKYRHGIDEFELVNLGSNGKHVTTRPPRQIGMLVGYELGSFAGVLDKTQFSAVAKVQKKTQSGESLKYLLLLLDLL